MQKQATWPPAQPVQGPAYPLNPYVSPNTPEPLSPWRIWEEQDTPKAWPPPEPQVTPDINPEVLDRYAKAGVPFPLNKEKVATDLINLAGRVSTMFAAQRVDDGSLHITRDTATALKSYMVETFRARQASLGGEELLCGFPIHLVDTPEQEGIFAPMQPFYRFVFV